MKTKNELDQRVGERLRSRRLKMGLSQTELGAAAGVSFQQIQKYEKGANRISAGRMVQFAERLGVAPAYLSKASAADRRPTAKPPRQPAPSNPLPPATRVWRCCSARRISEGRERLRESGAASSHPTPAATDRPRPSKQLARPGQ